MAALSDYLVDSLLNEALRATNFAAPATVYAALFTAAPTSAGGGTEVTGGSYARQAVTFGAPSSHVVANSALVTFPTASASWGTIVDVAFFDAATSGNMLFFGALTANKVIGNGDTLIFPIGNLTVALN